MLATIRTRHHSPVDSQQGILDGHHKYPACRRRGRISAAVQSICLSSSRGCIGNSTRPISDNIGAMAQPPVGRCMSRKCTCFSLLVACMSLPAVTIGGGPDYSYVHLSLRRPTGALLDSKCLQVSTKFSHGVPLPRVTWVCFFLCLP